MAVWSHETAPLPEETSVQKQESRLGIGWREAGGVNPQSKKQTKQRSVLN